ncbi:UbiA prenyltransferase [Mycena latifolia]|nr:UbiA prenyltransferase [Mycena latifolia]
MANRYSPSPESAPHATWSLKSIELSRIDRFAGTMILFWPYGRDIIDIDLDAKVERTEHRPLPDGRISVSQALVFLSMHVVLLFTMSRHLNLVAWRLAFLTVVPWTMWYDTIYGSQDKKDDIKAGVNRFVGGGALLLARDLWTTDLDNPKSCLCAFERNGFVIGPIVWVGCLLDYLL